MLSVAKSVYGRAWPRLGLFGLVRSALQIYHLLLIGVRESILSTNDLPKFEVTDSHRSHLWNQVANQFICGHAGAVRNRIPLSSGGGFSLRRYTTNSRIACGTVESNPTTSSIPASRGSAMENPLEHIPITTSFAGIPVACLYSANACGG